ncbi:hypothetical protein [Paenibacillus sp. A3M_27_13]|nr:hypothetical protein [Paenibacillus sp. A3M_27_13]MCP3746598.1 hypothetical protein [Paenibacillus sp. A3M_27_13]
MKNQRRLAQKEERIWYIERTYPNGLKLSLVAVSHLSGTVNLESFEQALN